MTVGISFVLGFIAFYALSKLLRALTFGGSRVGSGVRQRWLAKMDYESLLRTKSQIDEEIKRRQP